MQRKGDAFLRWHEPDDARVSRPDRERLGVKFPGPTRQTRRLCAVAAQSASTQ